MCECVCVCLACRAASSSSICLRMCAGNWSMIESGQISMATFQPCWKERKREERKEWRGKEVERGVERG